ncbi:MAG: serine hydrolase, partial [Calditrichaceae bacterium]
PAGVILLIIIYIIFSDTYYGRLIRWNFPDVYDYQKFPSVEIHKADSIFTYPQKFKPEIIANLNFENKNGTIKNLNRIIEETKTNALVIIQNDTVIYEQYFNGRNRESLCKAFSVTKSILSLMIGIALEEGYINNVNEPLKNYIGDFKNKALGEITIEQCMNQTTGIKFNNSMSSPFSDKPKFYYTKNVRELIKNAQLEEKPGTRWHNAEYNALLLAAVLENAAGVSVSQYLQEKIWKPLGMEYAATFSIDSKKHKFEHAADGLNARAIDYAKIGSLLLKNGNWHDKQIVPHGWIKKSVSLEGSSVTDWNGLNYKYLWWINRNNGDFQAIGHFGQYIFISPRSDMVIVRFGEEKGEISWWDKIFPAIISEIDKK